MILITINITAWGIKPLFVSSEKMLEKSAHYMLQSINLLVKTEIKVLLTSLKQNMHNTIIKFS